VRPSDVVGIVDATKKVNDHTYATAMGLLRVAYDTIIGSDESDSIKDKVNKLLRI
jgi:cell division protein FtsA